jgi:tetratricopeptide (TPR) repeat protein
MFLHACTERQIRPFNTWTGRIAGPKIVFVAGGTRAVAADTRDVDELPVLAMSRPREALARARAVLAGRPGPYEASVAHRAIAIVQRDHGDVQAAVREFRQALRLARLVGSAERETELLASLAVALVYAGRTAVGLATFEAALRRSGGVPEARVLHQRAGVLMVLGRYPAALEDSRHAVAVLRRAGDLLWTARALNTRANIYLKLGSPGRADADFVSAARIFAEIGQDLEGIYPVVNRALVAFASGDLPAALAYFDAAIPSYRRLNVPTTNLRINRCAVLLAAGLAHDALAEAEVAMQEMEEIRGRSTTKGELLLMAARCALAAAQPQAAQNWAQAGCRVFRAQRSAWWQAEAARVLVQARYAVGPASAVLLREAKRAAARLDALGSPDSARAHLVAGRVALELDRRDDAERHLAAAASIGRRGPVPTRAGGWLAEALRAQAANRPDRMLAACRQGLDALDVQRLMLGASELRAQVTVHGSELAALAQRHAARSGRPRRLLAWSERYRATAQAVPAVRPLADAELNASLAALRAVASQLTTVRSQGRPSAPLQREQQRLEGLVRASALHARGAAGNGRAAFRPADLLAELGETRAQLIEIVDIDGDLHVLACGGSRVRQFAAGRASDAVRAAEFARFALRRLARARPGDDPASALSVLAAAGPRLEQALLGPAARHLGDGDGPVIIVPPGKLQTIPWAILPALADRVVSVAPSAVAWMRARAAPPPEHRHVTLARGPGLASDGAEVPMLARLYDDVTVLSDEEATAEKVLVALDGAWLAHIAAHGTFRADSPLFSSLRMYDGPLTVYDFEQLQRAPYRLVLSSCDSGVLAPAGADELLGLVSSLLPLGTAGIVAAVVPLNDQAVVPLMVDLHRHLRAGQTLADAIYSVRRGLSSDPVQQATAASLITLGAG